VSRILHRLVKFAPLLSLLIPLAAAAQNDALQGHCTLGGKQALVSGLASTNYDQGIIPGCQVTVYYTGTTTLATIYSNVTGTPLSNPFTAVQLPSPNAGYWIFYAPDGQGYDVKMSGGGGNPACTTAPNCYTTPLTYTDLKVGSGGGGGGGQTILQFNSIPTSPVSPVNFINSAGCTWTLTAATASVSCNSSATPVPAVPLIYISGTQSSTNQVLGGHVSPIGITVPNNCTNIGASTLPITWSSGSPALPTASGTDTFYFLDFGPYTAPVAPTKLCTVQWTTGNSAGSVVTAGAASPGGAIAVNDLIAFVAAGTADASLINPSIAVYGTVAGGAGGGGSAFLTNSVLNSSQTLLNLVNAPNFNGLGVNFSNTSGGVVTLVFSGTLNNAGLTNPAMTVNGVTCTLGASCTVSGGGGTPGGSPGQVQFNNSGSFGGFTASGDATINTATGVVTVTGASGTPFGTFAFQNYATPPAIGGTTPNTGAFSTMKIGSLAGCLTATAGVISASGSCGSSPIWSALGNPTGNLGLAMGAFTSTFTWGAATGSSDLMKWTDTASNTGNGILAHFTTAVGSGVTPWQADANGVGWQVTTAGALKNVGSTVGAAVDFGQGSDPGSAAANTVRVYAPTSVTAYRIQLPGTVATSGNTFLSCTAASPSVCTWAAAGSAPAFSAITSATNTTAAMVCGTGCSLGVSGSGTNNATSVGGITITGTPSTGYVPTATSSSTATWQAAGGSGGYTNVTSAISWTNCTTTGNVCSTTGSVASVTASSLNTACTGNRLHFDIVPIDANTSQYVYAVQFNGDTGSHYYWNGSSSGSGTSLRVGVIGANTFAGFTAIDIYNFGSSLAKNAWGSTTSTNTGSAAAFYFGGSWIDTTIGSTPAITSVTFLDPGNNTASGSTFIAYCVN